MRKQFNEQMRDQLSHLGEHLSSMEPSAKKEQPAEVSGAENYQARLDSYLKHYAEMLKRDYMIRENRDDFDESEVVPDLHELLEKYPPANQVEANILFDFVIERGVDLLWDLDNYPEVDRQQLLDYMVSKGDFDDILACLDEFLAGVGSQMLIQRFAENRRLSDLVSYVSELTEEALMPELLKEPGLKTLSNNLSYFSNLTLDVAQKLIDAKHSEDVLSNLASFGELTHEQIVDLVVAAGDYHAVATNINDLYDLDASLAYKFINEGWAQDVMRYLGHFDNLDYNILAQALTDSGNIKMLGNDIEHFDNLKPEYADALIKNGFAKRVAYHWRRFDVKNGMEIAAKLVATGNGAALLSYISQFDSLDASLFLPLLELGADVMDNIDKFVDVDLQEISEQLRDSDKYFLLARGLKQFTDIDGVELAERMINDDLISELAEQLGNFSGLSYEVADTLIKSGYIVQVCYHLEVFVPFDHNILIDTLHAESNNKLVETLRHTKLLRKFSGLKGDKAILLVIAGLDEEIVDALDSFIDPDLKTLGQSLWNRQKYVILTSHLHKFPDINQPELAQKMLDWGKGDYYRLVPLVNNIKKFHGLPQQMFEYLYAFDSIFRNYICAGLPSFDMKPEDAADYLIRRGEPEMIVNHGAYFSKVNRASGETIKDAFLKKYPESIWPIVEHQYPRYISALMEFCNSFDPPLDKLYKTTGDIFGGEANGYCYGQVKLCLEGTVTDDMASLGIKRSGEKGLLDIRQKVGGLRHDLLSEELDLEMLESSHLAKKIVKQAVRYESSEWGDHDDASFMRIVGNYRRFEEEGEISPLNPAYEASKVIRVATVDREAQDSFSYSEPFKYKFSSVLSDLLEAQKSLDENRGMSGLFTEAEDIRLKILEGYQEKLPLITNEKARANITQRIADLESLNLKLMNDFQKNIKVLGQYTEFSSVLRRAIFTLSFLVNSDYRHKDLNDIDADQPTLEDIEWMLNFVEKTTNKETFAKFFDDPVAANRFKEVVNVRALSDELARAQNQDKLGTKPYKFIPSRGLLMEFSGHIADACWSNKYNSIAKSFPQMTSVVMVQNPGSRDERLAGSCMLIESEDASGRPLLIIRGFNPIENVINTLSVEDFYDKFTGYVAGLAAKTGRHPVIVADGERGMAGTNRPVLFDFISNNRGGKVALNEDPSHGFNGYNIRHSIHELRKGQAEMPSINSSTK